MFAIFYNINGPVLQVAVPKGKSITGTFYKEKVLKKLKARIAKRRPGRGIKYMSLFHDNAPAQKSAIVVDFLKQEKVRVLPHAPYSPDLAPCDFFLFPRLKKHLSGKHFASRQALGSAVYQCMLGIPPSDYEKSFKRWIKRLKRCIECGGEYFEGMKRKQKQ